MLDKKFKKFSKEISGYSQSDQNLIESSLIYVNNNIKNRDNFQNEIDEILSLASSLISNRFEHQIVVAAILSLANEYTKSYNFEEIENIFGKEIESIVKGVSDLTKISDENNDLLLNNDGLFYQRVDSYRKLFLAIGKDIRVVIIALFIRLQKISSKKINRNQLKEFFAIETIEIYAQIAERIGLSEIKSRLEDAAFPRAYPRDYKKFQEITSKLNLLDDFIPKNIRAIEEILNENKLRLFQVLGRRKHNFSLFQKIKNSYNFDLSKIFDLYAFRIIVESIEDCYKILGILHKNFQPVEERIYDYIAKPRKTGYQSLHTTLVDKSGQYFEVQIRTYEMHKIAEYGIAAHWHYKDIENNKKNNLGNFAENEWLAEIEKIKKIKNDQEFLSYIKTDFFSDKIFALTPKKEIFELPENSTPVDFAFRIHSKVGESCASALINGAIAPLNTKLKNNDVVEIITSKNARPSKDWLDFVVTTHARQKIRSFYRKENFDSLLISGKRDFLHAIEQYQLEQISEKEADIKLNQSILPFNTFSSALVALGEKNLSSITLLKVLYPEFKTNDKKPKKFQHQKKGIESLKSITHEYAGCCKPNQNSRIIGYISKNHIIKIHKKSCNNLRSSDKNRIIEI